MRYIKLVILAAFLSTMFTGCSYVSDTVEGAITERASFSATATYNGTSIDLTWDKTDNSEEFAGIEIYRTFNPNDEYAGYELIASRYYNGERISGNLDQRITSCTVSRPPASGIYFYRVGIINIKRDDDDNLYDATWESDYNSYTSIDAISGYARVVIP